MTDRLLKDTEAAVILGLSMNTLVNWRCQGKGPEFVKLGRAVRYRMSDLQKYIVALEGAK